MTKTRPTMSEPDTQMPTHAPNQPASEKVSLMDVLNFSSAASRIVTQEFGFNYNPDTEDDNNPSDGVYYSLGEWCWLVTDVCVDDDHALIFDNPFGSTMDSEDEDHL
ncbi:hypothetical protein BO94DRAFT_42936 [Aspergillus sclerotioniger CBS 115572]|uniref:Uncharacterized protein n=1 Tax=Aspergillus sclerotioniger CBS 115572 TaxID=1450535 RepID=A0A317WU70_9EURO|nr:hypothetical protein BO94DRAFT_42936 [Aspergillus sclerotioniger CBS 115572]PWY89635.1 hypothetical protein BO94DRAFT_42936 [Aspergillus sclerotioniger CBS 115572]